MGKKATAIVLAALLALGLSGCGSTGSSNGSRDNGTRNTYDNRDDYLNDFGRNRGLGEDIGRGLDNAVDDVEDTLTGDSRRYQEMLENGRVHDSDGFLLDGENRHD